MKQTTNSILMIRPSSFRMNEQTRDTNFFQRDIQNVLPNAIQAQAVKEFDVFVQKLRDAGVYVIVVEDSDQPNTPDAIFPINWISFHQNGTVGIYPMYAENRRGERREDILNILEDDGFLIEDVIDYSSAEEEEIYLEGLGSLVLDRVHKNAYCAISPRTDEDLAIEFCEDFEYTPIFFTANQSVEGKRKPIYHTDVMMSVLKDFAVVCLQAIDDKKERKQVIKRIKESGKELIAITESQVASFLGNILQVRGENGESIIVMSEQAEESLTKDQRVKIEKYGRVLSSSLKTIETCGGGSVRCMMAEVFLPKI